jgi:hypothetical protein
MPVQKLVFPVQKLVFPVQKFVFASETRQSRGAECASLPALERPAGDCRAAARNDIVKKRLFLDVH